MGVKILNLLSAAKNALLTTTYDGNYTFKGQKFIYNIVFELDGTKTYLFDFSSVVSANKVVVMLPIKIKTEAHNVHMIAYKGTDYIGGDPEKLSNLNEALDTAPLTVLTSNPTAATTKGTITREHVVFAVSSHFSASSGSGGSNDLAVLDGSKKYLFEFTSEEATTVEIDITMFEA